MTVWRHFEELTERFISPLLAYFGTLLPPRVEPSEAGPYDIPQLQTIKEFNATKCLAFIQERGSSLVFRQRHGHAWITLYERYLGSPNFKHWFAQQVTLYDQQLFASYQEKLCQFPIQAWFIHRHPSQYEISLLCHALKRATERDSSYYRDSLKAQLDMLYSCSSPFLLP